MRGHHGYVLAAGSAIRLDAHSPQEQAKIKPGEYTILDDTPPLPVPAWFLALCKRQTTRDPNKPRKPMKPGDEAAIAKARKVFAEAEPLVEYQRSDNAAIKLFNKAIDKGVSAEQAVDIATEPGGWNERNLPVPFDYRWLLTKARNAAASRQNDQGEERDYTVPPTFGPVNDRPSPELQADAVARGKVWTRHFPLPAARTAAGIIAWGQNVEAKLTHNGKLAWPAAVAQFQGEYHRSIRRLNSSARARSHPKKLIGCGRDTSRAASCI